jgi:hypothetical protein
MRHSEQETYDAIGSPRAQPSPPAEAEGDERLLAGNSKAILDGIFGCATPLQVETSAGFARYLSSVGLNQQNHLLFLRLLETNNKWVVDALIGDREPRLLFATIRPTPVLVQKAFALLAAWHPAQIYDKVMQAVLGIIETAYYQPDDGYHIHKLRIGGLNSLGKFLDEQKDQFDPNNEILLSALDRMTRLGTYEDNQRKRILSKHAFDIRIAYFDNRKRCSDVVPQLLMVRIRREKYEVKPGKEYIAYLRALERRR